MGCACRKQTPLIRVNKCYGLNLSNFPQKEIIPFVKYEKIPFLDIANMKKRKGRFMHYGYRRHNRSRTWVNEGEENGEGNDVDNNNNNNNTNTNNNNNIEHNDNVIANEIACNKDDCYKYNHSNTNNMYSTYCDEYVHNDVSPNNNNKGDK
jgi:hypothetical protein